MKLLHLAICFATSIISSCFPTGSEDIEFEMDSFPEIINLSGGKKYLNDSLKLGHPTLLRFHPDSFLVIEEYGRPYLVSIIDLKSGDKQQIIRQGRGPGEMIVCWGTELLDNEIYAFCGQLRKIIVYTPSFGRKFKISREFYLEEKETLRFYPLKDEIYLCLSNMRDKSRITYLDRQGKIIRKIGDYPPFLNSDEVKADNDIFVSSMSSTPDGSEFLLACSRTDIIELYDTDIGLIKRIQGPLGIKLFVNKQNFGGSFMLKPEPDYTTFGNVVANEKEFWVDYNGYRLEKNKFPTEYEQHAKQIFCFDWKGKPLRRIEFDYPILSFDVDWKDKILYTIIWKREDPEIITYPLTKILR